MSVTVITPTVIAISFMIFFVITFFTMISVSLIAIVMASVMHDMTTTQTNHHQA